MTKINRIDRGTLGFCDIEVIGGTDVDQLFFPYRSP